MYERQLRQMREKIVVGTASNVAEDLLSMPSARIGGFLCYFVSYDCVEPPHIHLTKGKERAGPSAKFWLESLSLANNRGLNASELKSAWRIVEENREFFLEMWHEHCND